MQTSLIHLPSTSKDRLAAAVTAAIALVGAFMVWPYARQPGPVVVPFLPIFATWVTLTEGLTAFLLWTQYRISGRLLFATLSGAYAFVSLIAAVQLLVFPGVFSPGGLLGAGAQTAVWIWVFWHGGFPALVTVSLAARSCAPSGRNRAPGHVALFGALALAFACAALAIMGKDILPVVVASGGSYSGLSSSPAALIVEATCLAALGLHVSTTRLRSLMDLWLAVALLAALIDVTLTLSAGARYSVGWYAARVASMLSSSAVLGMLIYETSGLYRKLTDAHVKLIESSARDGLTGVFNRAYFDERYSHEHTLAASSGYSLCVLLIDVDNFKAYNDTFGHLAGDDCLRNVAHALTATLTRTGGFVARYGGEEFVVVLPACDAAASLAVAEKLRAAVEQAALPAPRAGAVVTISVGHACRDAASRQTAKALLEAADAALYAAKAGGRNRVASARLDKPSGSLVRQTSAS